MTREMNSKIMTYIVSSGGKFAPSGLLLSILLSLLMLVLGDGNVWGETIDFNLPNGYYFLGNEAGDNGVASYAPNNFTANFYMCPAEGAVNAQNYLNGESNKPLITTLKSFTTNGKTYSYAIWYIEAATGDNEGYFYIKHYETGKYMVANDNTSPTATRRRVNLGPTEKPVTNDGLFRIQSDDGGATFYISPREKHVENNDGDNKYLSPAKGNKDYLYATSDASSTGGTIGLWAGNTKNSAWHFVDARCVAPTITYDKDTYSVTISTETADDVVYYTTGGAEPTTSSTNNGTSSITITNVTGRTAIKAIAANDANRRPSIVVSQIILPEATIELAESSYSYTGEEIEPTVTVKDGSTVIDPSEYTVTYSNNVNAGENTATVTITDKEGGDYIVYGTTTFTIEKATISPTVSIVGWTYGETPNEPTVDGNSGNGSVTYKYKASDAETYSETVPTDAGNYMLIAIIAETENTSGATTVPFEFAISPKSLGDGYKAAEGIDIQMEQVEDHVEVTSVKDGETPLVENKDYIVTIEEQGVDWIVIVSGIGNYGGAARGLFVHAEFINAAGADKAVAAYRARTDLSKPAGTSIYIVRKVIPSIGSVVISPVDYLPKDVPVLMLRDNESTGFLASEKPDESVDGISEITAETRNSNLLQVSDGTVAVEAAQVYMYFNGVFVQTFNGILPNGSFYLYNPNYKPTTSTTGDSAPLQLVIEGTTGIEDERRMMEGGRGEKWYTLDGRCLCGKPTTKGLYFNNGHKMIVK